MHAYIHSQWTHMATGLTTHISWVKMYTHIILFFSLSIVDSQACIFIHKHLHTCMHTLKIHMAIVLTTHIKWITMYKHLILFFSSSFVDSEAQELTVYEFNQQDRGSPIILPFNKPAFDMQRLRPVGSLGMLVPFTNKVRKQQL